jgi:FecR protein
MLTKKALVMLFTLILTVIPVLAQDSGELAATLEVLAPTVEVLRVNTVNWIAVKAEAIVGVGDTIRTNEAGRARVTFFADGTDTELLPNTEYRIERFESAGESFNLSVEVIVGQTTQRLARLLDAGSSYNITTPGMVLAARGTAFALRVENSGRAAMLVSEGNVQAEQDSVSADVPPEFGVRAASGAGLSDVVRAKTFDELDAALDGCAATLTTPDDVRLNVRIGASMDFPRVGTIDAADVTNPIGVSDDQWYRIPFQGGFGWILSSTAKIEAGCAGLRQFDPAYGPENAALYTSVGEVIELDRLTNLPEPEATESP